MGATPIVGDAESPEAWIAEATSSRVMIDLIQPEIPRRVTSAAIQKVSAQRLTFTRKLTAALQQLSPAERPLLLSISGTDDLEPSAIRHIDGSSELRRTPVGFAHIGIPVRKWIENAGIHAAFVYLGTVYGPGKSFATTVFPRIAKGTWRVFGRGDNHIPLIHVEDAARGLVHLANRDASLTQQRSFVLAEPSVATAKEFFTHAAKLLGARVPGNIGTGVASLIAGRVLVETMTRDLIADGSDLIRTGFRFKYSSYLDGLPPTLEALGYRIVPENVVSTRKSRISLWLLFFATIGVLLAENLLNFRLSVPYMSALSGGLPLLDMRIWYSSDEAYRLFEAFGAAGRDAYQHLFLTVDILIPFMVSLFLWSAMSQGALRRFRALALAGGAFDYLENGVILVLLANYPQRLDQLVTLAALFTLLKQSFYALGLGLSITGLILSWFAKRPRAQ
jgi:NAD dependent epimerase/dehydratase family enzyme